MKTDLDVATIEACLIVDTQLNNNISSHTLIYLWVLFIIL